MAARKLPRIHGTMPMARKCACEICTPVRTAEQRAWKESMRVKRAKGVPIPDHVHGLNGYNNYACRCEVCKAAAAANQQAGNTRRSSAPIPEHVHGTENGYGNYRCRCEPCTAAWAAGSNARTRRRTARKAASKEQAA